MGIERSEERERRRSTRRPTGAESRVSLRLPSGAVLTTVCYLIDASDDGVGFEHWSELAVGERLVLHRLARCDALVCVVRHCRPLAGGSFHIGVRVVSQLGQLVTEPAVDKALTSDGNRA
jgi:hypothetical protein